MQKIKRLLKKFKYSGRSAGRVLVCPRCGSTRVHLSSRLDAWLTPKKYFCEDCGYVGPVIMEVEKEELEKRRD